MRGEFGAYKYEIGLKFVPANCVQKFLFIDFRITKHWDGHLMLYNDVEYSRYSEGRHYHG